MKSIVLTFIVAPVLIRGRHHKHSLWYACYETMEKQLLYFFPTGFPMLTFFPFLFIFTNRKKKKPEHLCTSNTQHYVITHFAQESQIDCFTWDSVWMFYVQMTRFFAWNIKRNILKKIQSRNDFDSIFSFFRTIFRHSSTAFLFSIDAMPFYCEWPDKRIIAHRSRDKLNVTQKQKQNQSKRKQKFMCKLNSSIVLKKKNSQVIWLLYDTQSIYTCSKLWNLNNYDTNKKSLTMTSKVVDGIFISVPQIKETARIPARNIQSQNHEYVHRRKRITQESIERILAVLKK